jgi:hypothetical protein
VTDTSGNQNLQRDLAQHATRQPDASRANRGSAAAAVRASHKGREAQPQPRAGEPAVDKPGIEGHGAGAAPPPARGSTVTQ